MARDYSRIATSMWRDDDDFRALAPAAKLVYLMLLTQPNVSACGLLDLTEGRWAANLGMTREQLAAMLRQLDERRFVILDVDAEQLLIRTFVKWDGGANNEKRRSAITAATAAVSSPAIAAVLVDTLAGYGIPHRLSRAHGIGHPMPPAPVDNRGEQGLSDAPSDARLVVVNQRNQNDNPQPTTRNPDPQPPTGSREPSPTNGPRPPETCPKHPAGTDQPCTACKRARLTAETWDREAPARRRAAAEARLNAITACTHCDPDGWQHDQDGQPTTTRCTHTETTP